MRAPGGIGTIPRGLVAPLAQPPRLRLRPRAHGLEEQVLEDPQVHHLRGELRERPPAQRPQRRVEVVLALERATPPDAISRWPGVEVRGSSGVPLSGTHSRSPPAPPTIGADTDAVLSELGYSDEDITAFRVSAAI